jgi:hypothetical protein
VIMNRNIGLLAITFHRAFEWRHSWQGISLA